jgi:hypothetical protein
MRSLGVELKAREKHKLDSTRVDSSKNHEREILSQGRSKFKRVFKCKRSKEKKSD